MTSQPIDTSAYHKWLKEIKQRVRQAQLKAAVQVNSTLLTFYWELGADIVERQKSAHWGSGFLTRLSTDLMTEFPDMKGFSERNLKYIRQWHTFYSEGSGNWATACGPISNPAKTGPPANQSILNLPSIVTRLVLIPWGHNRVIITKCEDVTEAL